MSESKHTAGPWKITRDQRSPCAIESTKEPGAALALVYLTNPKTKKREPEFTANANLIAAAPELLEALEGLLAEVQHLERDYPEDYNFKRYRDALVKTKRTGGNDNA